MALHRISSLLGFAGKQVNLDTNGSPMPAAGYGRGTLAPLRDVLNELQGLSFAVGTGHPAGSGVAISGLGANDTLVVTVVFASGVPTVPTDGTISAAGTVTFATTNTSGASVLAAWYKKQPRVLRP